MQKSLAGFKDFKMDQNKFLHDISNDLTLAMISLQIEIEVSSQEKRSLESLKRIETALLGIERAVSKVQKFRTLIEQKQD